MRHSSLLDIGNIDSWHAILAALTGPGKTQAPGCLVEGRVPGFPVSAKCFWSPASQSGSTPPVQFVDRKHHKGKPILISIIPSSEQSKWPLFSGQLLSFLMWKSSSQAGLPLLPTDQSSTSQSGLDKRRNCRASSANVLGQIGGPIMAHTDLRAFAALLSEASVFLSFYVGSILRNVGQKLSTVHGPRRLAKRTIVV